MDRKILSEKIISSCLEMNALGLNQGTSGNISVRYEGGMLITPSGIAYNKLTPEMIVYVDQSGTFEKGKIPSSEWHFHLLCYKTRPELNAVVHNHATNATAVSILNQSIPAIHYMCAVTGIDHVPCIPYSTYGSVALSEDVAIGINKSKAILMQHHGMIAMEVNLDKALWLANEIEVLAELYLKVRAIQKDVPVLSENEMKVVIKKFENYGLKTG